ncbi:MAG: alpha/beta hydrolase, partial [Sciscionella sp.]
ARQPRPTLLVLVLHGGRARGERPVRRTQLAYLRMVQLAMRLAGACRGENVAVTLLRYRRRGWNEPHQDPVLDARWAIERMRARFPCAPVALVGHSMGGRVALRLASEPGVAAVCALAPWIEPGEPMAQLAGRTILLVHGDRDRRTDPVTSRRFAENAGVTWLSVPGSGHAMLRRSRRWVEVVLEFLIDVHALTARHLAERPR